MDSKATNPEEQQASFLEQEPQDADDSFIVNVMLMTSESLDYLYKNCCRMSGGNAGDNLQHVSKVLSFLLGQKSNCFLVFCWIGKFLKRSVFGKKYVI